MNTDGAMRMDERREGRRGDGGAKNSIAHMFCFGKGGVLIVLISTYLMDLWGSETCTYNLTTIAISVQFPLYSPHFRRTRQDYFAASTDAYIVYP